MTFQSTYAFQLVTHQERINEITNLLCDKSDDDVINHYVKFYPFEDLLSSQKKSYLFDRSSNKFLSNVGIKDLVYMHLFESRLKSTLLRSILIVENLLKENLSYVVAEKIGIHTYHENRKTDLPNDYLNENEYNHNNKDTSTIIQSLKEYCVKPRDFQKNIISYKSKSNLPPWILAKDIYFKNVIDWYYVLKTEYKECVVKNIFGNKLTINTDLTSFFINALRILSEARNICAHSTSLLGFKAKSSLDFNFINNNLPGLIEKKNYTKNGVGKNDLLSVFISLLIILDKDTSLMLLYELISIDTEFSKMYNFESTSFYEIDHLIKFNEKLEEHYVFVSDDKRKY